MDCQGSGDCGFRTCAMAISSFQGKELNEEASKLRVMTVGYLIKQKTTLAAKWKPDPGATAEQCAGEDIPVDFSDYCMLASKQKFWCDRMLLLLDCLTKKYELCVCVVFVWNTQEKIWQRNVLAHTLQGDVAKKIEAGIPVLTMMLINNHVWLLQPPDAQTPCPETPCPDAWLLKTPGRPREHLKGAGKSCILSLPPSSTKRSSQVRARSQLGKKATLSLPASSSQGHKRPKALSLPNTQSHISRKDEDRLGDCSFAPSSSGLGPSRSQRSLQSKGIIGHSSGKPTDGSSKVMKAKTSAC